MELYSLAGNCCQGWYGAIPSGILKSSELFIPNMWNPRFQDSGGLFLESWVSRIQRNLTNHFRICLTVRILGSRILNPCLNAEKCLLISGISESKILQFWSTRSWNARLKLLRGSNFNIQRRILDPRFQERVPQNVGILGTKVFKFGVFWYLDSRIPRKGPPESWTLQSRISSCKYSELIYPIFLLFTVRIPGFQERTPPRILECRRSWIPNIKNGIGTWSPRFPESVSPECGNIGFLFGV